MDRLLLAMILTAALAATGCAHFRIAPRDVAPSTLEQHRRVHVVGWGMLTSRVEPMNCEGAGLARVTMNVTPLDALAAVVTAGFWSTATIEWTCAKDRTGRRP